MTITILDASNYLRGLLVLIRRNGKISEQERAFVMRAGKSLGFEEGFCTNAIREILDNTFIDESQPVFSTRELAVGFVRDGLTVAHADNQVEEPEEQWLRTAAERNGIPSPWFNEALKNVKKQNGEKHVLESERLVVNHC